MAFNRKVLWIVSMDNGPDEQLFAQHVDSAGIDTVCIRTTSLRLAYYFLATNFQNPTQLVEVTRPASANKLTKFPSMFTNG